MHNRIVRVEHLYHKYAASWAIQDISFEVNSRGVLGLLGSNGAGKSTTMNIMCGVLNQTAGNVWINDISLRTNPMDAKRWIGFLPQVAPLHMDLTIDEYLTHCAYLRLMNPGDIPSAVAEVKERCGIAQFSKRVIRYLSGGYRQRVGIAQAIIHKPKLVVLDEATNGLDPVQILEVRKLIHDIGKERAVIFSSHILPEVQATCSEVIMIEQGKIVFSNTMEVFNNYIKPHSLIIKMELPPPIEEITGMKGVKEARQLDEYCFRLQFDEGRNLTQQIIIRSIEKGWRLTEIYLEKSSLDEIFTQLTLVGNKNEN